MRLSPRDFDHCTVVELYREGVTKLFHQMEVNETLILFFTFGKWKKIHNVPCVCSPYYFQETVICTKNHQKWVIFRFLKLLKKHKSWSKNSLKLVFYQNISKTIEKVQIWTNIQKLPMGLCHPLKLLCIAIKIQRVTSISAHDASL